jgi:DNA-binding protein HU-beta
MATRKTRNPELAAAAGHLAEAAHLVRQAVSKKIDAFGASAAGELNKAKMAAAVGGTRANRRFESLMRKAQQQLAKATNAAKGSLHKAVRESEKRLQAMDKAVKANLAKLQRAGQVKAAAAKKAAKKAPAKKTAKRRSAV